MKKALSLILIILLIVATMASCEILGGNSGNNGGNTDSGNNGGNTDSGNNGGNTDSGNNGGNTGDSGNQGQSKRVPIYQGMTIGSVKETAVSYSLPTLWNGTNNGNGNSGDNGNHYGQYKGDHVGKDEAVDEENPYPDNSENENIETEIESSLKVEGAVHDIYYATPNEDIYIYIHINNPDNFEIVSFTLNGKKYASYMFEDGSDMETIILKYNVGGTSGIVEYTIDAIKYIDGTEIKDVIIDGDKTVRAGIRTGNQVAANISNLTTSTNGISFNVNVKDYDGLVEYFEGGFKAILYDGTNIVAEKSIELGDNDITFDGLKTNTLYQYAIVAYYDDLSGSGFGMHMLHKDALYTDSVVLFDNIMIGQEGIEFTLTWHEDHQGKNLTSLKLYKGESLVKELDSKAISIDGLLSANTYTIVAQYENAGETESIYLDFTTFEKGIPGFSLNVGSVTQDSISFNIHEVDEENVGSITKIELVHKNGTTVAKNVDVREFNDLLSDNEYTVRVTYTYNLNDGSGDKTVIKDFKSTTHKKEVPQISIFVPECTQTSIWFDIFEKDSDKVGEITSIDVKDKDGNIVKSGTDIRMISGLLSGSSYEMTVAYTYNLNDGTGDHVLYYTATGTTLAKIGPEIFIINPNSTQDSVSFEVEVDDIDNVGNITKVELIDKNGKTVASGTNVRTFVDLLSNNTYTIRVTYTYDLNDGNGDQIVTEDMAVTTIAKATPAISIINPNSTQDSVSFEVEVDDIDNVGNITKVELIDKNGKTVASGTNVRTFVDLLSNNTYTIRVTYTYNLNDGNGDQVITEDMAVTTLAKAEPVVNIDNINSTTDSIKGDFIITDDDGTLVDYRIDLYKGNTIVSADVEKIDFTSLTYYTDYTIKITYTYDLKDGNDVQTKIVKKSVTTLPYIDVTGCNIANTSAVSEGDTIFMQVTLDNPLNMTVESVVINGETYNVTGASTAKKIFVEIVYNGQFAGGDTYLKIDKVNAKIDSTSVSIEPKSEFADNVFINGKLEILKVEFTNEKFEPIDWAFPNEKVYMLVTLDNATGYNIENVSFNLMTMCSNDKHINNLTKIDNNRWYVEVGPETKLNCINLNSITYSNKYISEKTISANIYSPYLYLVTSNEVKYISTADDLKNMSDGYYYELKNDIDLSGLEWRGSDFLGVFDAKGYSIKNMSFVGSIKNSDVYLGLFSTGCGIISNLNLIETTIIAELSSNDGRTYQIYCGGIAGTTEGLYFKLHNCTVDEYSIISVNNMSEGNTYVGGLLGSTNRQSLTYATIHIDNCVNSASVSATESSNFSYVGGLVGHIYNHEQIAYITNSTNAGDVNGYENVGGLVGYSNNSIKITNSNNSGHISGTYYVGGFIGYSYSSSVFTNCTNSGSISDGYNIGGFIGYSSYSSSVFTNCTNSGSIDGDSIAGGFIGYSSSYSSSVFTNCTNSGSINGVDRVGGFIGYSYDSSDKFTNSYSLYQGNVINGEICTLDQLNSKSFYTDVLGWSEDIWDLSELDIENGKYPKLK